jgi:hypothetical protein
MADHRYATELFPVLHKTVGGPVADVIVKVTLLAVRENLLHWFLMMDLGKLNTHSGCRAIC